MKCLRALCAMGRTAQGDIVLACAVCMGRTAQDDIVLACCVIYVPYITARPFPNCFQFIINHST
jgi:hypothetical protein